MKESDKLFRCIYAMKKELKPEVLHIIAKVFLF